MNRQQLRVLRQMAQDNIDPKKPFEYIDGKFIQQEALEASKSLGATEQDSHVKNDEKTELAAEVISKQEESSSEKLDKKKKNNPFKKKTETTSQS